MKTCRHLVVNLFTEVNKLVSDRQHTLHKLLIIFDNQLYSLFKK